MPFALLLAALAMNPPNGTLATAALMAESVVVIR